MFEFSLTLALFLYLFLCLSRWSPISPHRNISFIWMRVALDLQVEWQLRRQCGPLIKYKSNFYAWVVYTTCCRCALAIV